MIKNESQFLRDKSNKPIFVQICPDLRRTDELTVTVAHIVPFHPSERMQYKTLKDVSIPPLRWHYVKTDKNNQC